MLRGATATESHFRALSMSSCHLAMVGVCSAILRPKMYGCAVVHHATHGNELCRRGSPRFKHDVDKLMSSIRQVCVDRHLLDIYSLRPLRASGLFLCKHTSRKSRSRGRLAYHKPTAAPSSMRCRALDACIDGGATLSRVTQCLILDESDRKRGLSFSTFTSPKRVNYTYVTLVASRCQLESPCRLNAVTERDSIVYKCGAGRAFQT